MAPEGDCTSALAALDGTERASAADSFDLASREEIEVDFGELPPGEWGLVISSRQTLLSTFLFYQTLAYMGETAGAWFAALERGDARAHGSVAGLERALGGIEVLVPDEHGAWQVAASVQEAGPLATDTRVLPIPAGTRPSRIRLRLTRGLWRIDAVALARLHEPAEMRRITPATVLRDGEPDHETLAALTGAPTTTGRDRLLTMMPGDAVTLVFELPRELVRAEIFLESRGYYLEWMREEWLREENAESLAQILFEPAEALRALAPEFKAREASMEAAFWGSRFATPRASHE